MERMSANGLFFHRNCFKCSHCNCKLKMGNYSLSKGVGSEKGKFFCSVHYRQLFMSNPEAINYSRADAPKREQSKTDLSAEKEKSTQQINSKPKQEITKSKSVEDTTQRTEQVHISVEEVTEQSNELPENEAEVLSGDEHRELNGDLPTDEDLPPEDLVFNGVHLEEEEMVADLQADEEAGRGDLLEDEVGNSNGDDLEMITNTVNIKLGQAPQQVTPQQLADISIENCSSSSTLHVDDQFSHDDESEKQPTIVAVDKQFASPSHEPEKPTPKPGITDTSTYIPPHQNGRESEQITFTALEQEAVPRVTNKTDVITENSETSCAPCGDRSDSERTTDVAEVGPVEGEQTTKTDATTEKHHNASHICSDRESDNLEVIKPVAVDNETAHQNGEPKQPTCTSQTPAQQKRVMLIV
jgi:hypothetical protein